MFESVLGLDLTFQAARFVRVHHSNDDARYEGIERIVREPGVGSSRKAYCAKPLRRVAELPLQRMRRDHFHRINRSNQVIARRT